MTTRVLIGWEDIPALAEAVKQALRDPEVGTIILHKPHARFVDDGREVLIDQAGKAVVL